MRRRRGRRMAGGHGIKLGGTAGIIAVVVVLLFGAPGDFARAYVIGTMDEVNRVRAGSGQARANRLSVMMETGDIEACDTFSR